MKIAICLPVHGDTRALFTYKLARLIAETHRRWSRPEPLNLEVFMAESSSVAGNRQYLADQAMNWGAETILWLDSDQTFPADSLLRLLSLEQPLVGTNSPDRSDRALPTARQLADGKPVRIWTTKEKAEAGVVEPVHFMGFPVCLVSAEVLKAMSPPYFSGANEDHYFFRKAAEAGFTPMLDHQLSAKIGHLRIQELTNDHSLETLARESRTVALNPGGGRDAKVTGRLWGDDTQAE